MSQQPNTHILVREFAYHEPSSLDEATELLLAHDAQVIAGGTDALVHMKMERSAPARLVSLRRVPGLRGITADEDGVTIGAMVTIAEIAMDPLIRGHYLALAEACDAFSTTQVATMGTLGGNIANASPAADTAPALLALGAEVIICGPGRERRVPIEKFFVGPGRSALARGEIVTGVRLPGLAGDTKPDTSSRPVRFGAAFLEDGARGGGYREGERGGGRDARGRPHHGRAAGVRVRGANTDARAEG
jgi:CO/xanthine dehydrogenase FAD-binding subunit